ncbi:sulfite exporter TauE/SafE family protein [Jeotgalibacillus sp. R-1-5s-1]|uniref:sulfite exporter TauE/SafE family protein n=1 Tax=Jeotgalibacillus sp. R-1-5s-1 TaxID=2555897 RepID=UPI001069952D|nr:sulfite exporter TauE/SafE family protein [Jeotgalibacillus sp. R-1-5s-1]TFD95903.1 sulfite exporter TauE/SafE family protein [Jeotgalibacillus sp. R-1-5s-1]
MELILLAFIGLVAGAVGSLIGLGGGVIVVPALLFFGSSLMWIDGITPQTAVGISLVVMIFTGLSSTLAYLKTKTVDVKSGLLFFAGSGPGAVVGSWVNQYLTLGNFHLAFGLFMIFLSFILLIRNRIKPIEKFKTASFQRHFTDSQGQSYQYGFPPLVGVAAAFAVGFASGLFGIGGGSVMVPIMIIAFLFPPHVAVGTSMLMVFLSSILGSASHIMLGNVNWLYVAALAPGAWFGAKLGAWLNQKLDSNGLVLALRIILVLIGIRSIFEGLYGV